MDTLAVQFKFHLLTWLSKNREVFPRYLLATACAVGGFFLAWLILTIAHPYRAEILQNTLITLGVILNVCLAIITAICAAAFLLWNFGRGVTVSVPEVSGLLGAGSRNWVEPDISPNVLVCLRPGETAAEFSERMEAAKGAASPQRWVLVIPFRGPKAFVFDTPNDGAVMDISRNAPAFQHESWPDDQRPYATAYFVYETPQDYQAYVSWFCYYFLEWAESVKVSNEETAIGKTMMLRNTIKAAMNTVVLLLFCLPVFAQNAEAAKKVLGKHAGEVPKAGEQVEYVFANGKEHYRRGNDRSNYIQLLEGVPTFRYPSAPLLYVQKNGEVVAKGSAAGEVSRTQYAMRTEGSAIPPETLPGFTLPDSIQSAETARMLSEKSREWSQGASEAIKPWWKMVMDFYWDWFWLTLILTVGPWIMAKVTSREGFWDLHRFSKRIVIVTTGISVFLFSTNLMFLAKWAGWPNWVLAVCAVLICVVGVWAYDRLNPDYNPKPGNDARNVKQGQYNHNQLSGG